MRETKRWREREREREGGETREIVTTIYGAV
jgi:hypothetical protein